MSSKEVDFKTDLDKILHARMLRGVDFKTGLDKVLDAIDRGVSTADIHKDPLKYIVSGNTKEIIINTGGEGLKISPEIINELAKRGDKLAQKIIDKNKFQTYIFSDEKYAWFENYHGRYDRENKILIEIIKENKFDNGGGMNLEVHKVYDENWTYKVVKSNDHWGSEYIEGWHELVAPKEDDDEPVTPKEKVDNAFGLT